MNIQHYAKVFRFDHWIKNIFVLFGLMGACFYYKSPWTWEIVKMGLFSLLLSCFISSVNYIMNEILDSPYDKLHPTKKFRPIPSGKITIFKMVVTAMIVFCVVEVFAWKYFSLKYNISLIALFIAGLLYNVHPIRLKDLPYIDVVVESINNPIRLLIGWYTITENTHFPPWTFIWIFWVFGIFLMTAKRLAEFRLLGKTSHPYRKVFQYYSQKGLLFVMMLSSLITIFVYFLISIHFGKYLIFGLPFLVIFIIWFVALTFQKNSIVVEPEDLVKKPLFLIYSLMLCIFMCFLAIQ